MNAYKTQYQIIANQLLAKISPLYILFPWDDLYNDTLHGSRELDNFANEVQKRGTASEIDAVKVYNEALIAERKINVSNLNSEKTWEQKLNAANILLERIDPFVNAIIAYYKRTVH